MKNRLLNRTFLSLFVAVLSIILVVEVISYAYSFRRQMESSEQYTQQENQQSIEQMTESLNNIFINENQLAINLSQMAWVVKLSSYSEAFDNDFPYSTRQEIINNYLFSPGVNDAAQTRFLYVPYRDLAVSANAWNDAGDYVHKMLNIPYKDRNLLLNEIITKKKIACVECVNEEHQVLVTPNLLIAIPIRIAQNVLKAYLCVVLNTEAVRNGLSSRMSSGISGLRITEKKSGKTILEIGREAQHAVTEKRDISLIDWDVSYFISPEVITVNQDARQSVGLYVLLFLGGIVFSFFLAFYIYRPLEKLLDKLPGEASGRNMLRDLDSSVTRVMESYRENRRFTLLHHLLTGYFEADSDAVKVLGFDDSMVMQVFLCIPRGKEQASAQWLSGIEAVFAAMQDVHWDMIEAYNRNMVLIVGYSRSGAEEEYTGRIFSACNNEEYEVYVGNPSVGLVGVSISYQSAMERRLFLNVNAKLGYYFPLDWENLFLTSLRQGNAAVADGILDKTRNENEKRLAESRIGRSDCLQLTSRLIADLHRIVDEVNLDEMILTQTNILTKQSEWTTIYEEIRHVTGVICETVSGRSEAVDETEQKIVDYVDMHYHEPSLSVTRLQDEFGMSATTLNKCIKNITGQTFQPYLTMRRMEEAKELLSKGTVKVTTVSQLIGYENDYSFRRAFQHYTGIRVQDYRQMINRKDETGEEEHPEEL